MTIPSDRWVKAKASETADACVELRTDAGTGHVLVRDSKQGEASPVLSFTPSEFAAFKAGVRAGEFD